MRSAEDSALYAPTVREPFWKRHYVAIILLAILVCSTFFRFYGREFDQHTSQHPDERTVINYAQEINWPSDLSTLLDWHTSTLNLRRDQVGGCTDPTGCTYPYGALPTYLERAVGWGMYTVLPSPDPQSPDYWVNNYNAIQDIGRTLASIFDLLTILLTFLIARRLYSANVGLIAAALYGFAATAIQIAHFFISDSFLVTFMMGVLYFSVVLMQKPSWWAAAGAGACLGLAVATKVSVGAFALVIIAAVVLRALYSHHTRQLGAVLGDPVGMRPASKEERERPLGRHLLGGFGYLVIAGVFSLLAFAIAEPYVLWSFNFAALQDGFKAFLDSNPWWRRIESEAAIQAGTSDVPYTRQYVGTVPVLYHIQQMVFWGMGLIPGVVAVAGFIAGIWQALRRRPAEILLMAGAIPYFLTIAGLLAKWMRYMLPILPIFCILAGALLVRGTIWAAARFRVRPWRHTGAARLVRAQRLVFPVLTALSVGSAFLWAVAYMNIYSQPESRVQASTWADANIPAGAVIGKDTGWDDTVPFPQPQWTFADTRAIEFYDYKPPDQELQSIKDWLKGVTYIAVPSNRVYSSVSRMPWAYPVQIQYYQLLYAEKLGFVNVNTTQVMPQLFGIDFNDQSADESFTVYDHPRVDIFKKVSQLTDTELDTLFAPALNRPELFIAGTNGKASDDKGLAYSQPVSSLPQVTDYAWNPLAQDDTQWIGVLLWLLVVEVLGLLALPIVFTVCRNLPDRGWAVSKAVALLLVAWGAWFAASARLIPFTVWSVLLFVLLLAAFSLVCWRLGAGAAIREFVRTKKRLVVTYEAVFLLAFAAFLVIRMLNPDLWQTTVGGEKPMEMGFLNSTLRSPWMPALDPFFSGGFINYYYYGYFVIACIIKLVGINPAIAFNLAIPLFYGLAFTVAMSLVYNIVAWAQKRRGSTSPVSANALAFGFLAAVLTFAIGNLHGFFQWVILTFPSLGQQLITTAQSLGEPSGAFQTAYTTFDFWGSRSIINNTINEFPFWTFLFADLHPHLIDMPFTLVTAIFALNIVFAGAFRKPLSLAATGLRWWQRIWLTAKATLAWLWGPGTVGALTLGLMGLLLGALFVINSWDFPTFLGITGAGVLVALLLVGRYGETTEDAALGINVEATSARRISALDRLLIYVVAFGSTGLLAGLALLTYIPFFLNFKAFFTAIFLITPGEPLPDGTFMTRTTMPEYLIIWGLFIFAALSYMVYRLWSFPWRAAWNDLLGLLPSAATPRTQQAPAPQQAFQAETAKRPVRRPTLALATAGANGGGTLIRTLSLPLFFASSDGEAGGTDAGTGNSTEAAFRRRPRMRVVINGANGNGSDTAVVDATPAIESLTSPNGNGSHAIESVEEPLVEATATNGHDEYGGSDTGGWLSAAHSAPEAEQGEAEAAIHQEPEPLELPAYEATAPGNWLAEAHSTGIQVQQTSPVLIAPDRPGVLPLWSGLLMLALTAMLSALQLATGQWLLALLVALIGGIAATSLTTSRSAANLFTGVLLVGALIVTMGVELVYLADHLQGGASYRMNTVFKFYVQAWLLFGTGTAAAAYYMLHGLRERAASKVESGKLKAESEEYNQPALPTLGFTPSTLENSELPTTEEPSNWLVWSVEHAEDTAELDGAIKVESGKLKAESEEYNQPEVTTLNSELSTFDFPLSTSMQVSSRFRWTGARISWAIAFGILLVASLFYTALGTPARLAQRFPVSPPIGTLDGQAFMNDATYSTDVGGSRPNNPLVVNLKYDLPAIQWLNANVQGDAVIAELPVEYYRAYGMRVASNTGLSSVVGNLHQDEQRADGYSQLVSDRVSDMNTLYTTQDLQLTLTLISKYDINYIYVGQLEQSRAGAAGMSKFTQLANPKIGVLKEVFRVDAPSGLYGTVIYQVQNPKDQPVKTLIGAPVKGSGVPGLSITPLPTATATPMPTPPSNDPQLQALIAAVQANPTDRDTRMKLVDWYSDSNHSYPADAARELQTLVEQNPTDIAIRQRLGDAYQAAGQPDQALKAWEDARDVDPNNPNGHNKLGLAYENRKRYDDAIKEFQAAVQKDPSFVEADLHLGEVYQLRGDVDNARNAYQQCINNAKPGDPWVADAKTKLAALK